MDDQFELDRKISDLTRKLVQEQDRAEAYFLGKISEFKSIFESLPETERNGLELGDLSFLDQEV